MVTDGDGFAISDVSDVYRTMRCFVAPVIGQRKFLSYNDATGYELSRVVKLRRMDHCFEN